MALSPMESEYLPALVLERPDAGVDDFIGPPQVGVAKGHLLIENADRAVGLAIEREQDSGIINPGLLAIAHPHEPGIACVLLIVEAKVAFIGVISEGHQLGVVVGRQASGRKSADGQARDLLKEADDLLRCGVNRAGRYGECAQGKRYP